MRPRPDVRSEAGFSLIELLVVIVLLSLLGGVVTTSVIRSLQVSAAATTRVDALTALQQAQERMSRVIREGMPLATPTPAAGNLSMLIVTDATTYRVVTYTHAGDEVRMTTDTYTVGVATPTATETRLIIDQLDQGTTPVFTYQTADGGAWQTTMPVGLIRRITMTLVHRMDGPPIPLTTGVFPRNAVLEPLP